MRPMGISLLILQDRMISGGYCLEPSGGSSTSGTDIWSFGKVIRVRSSLTCQVALLGSLAMINYMSATPTPAFAFAVIYLKAPGRGIIV